LASKPQLAYALFQAMLLMNIVDPSVLQVRSPSPVSTRDTDLVQRIQPLPPAAAATLVPSQSYAPPPTQTGYPSYPPPAQSQPPPSNYPPQPPQNSYPAFPPPQSSAPSYRPPPPATTGYNTPQPPPGYGGGYGAPPQAPPGPPPLPPHAQAQLATLPEHQRVSRHEFRFEPELMMVF
jgi:cleavage stimulation factor subunit 2